ncbi:MAG: hypothetical protein ACHQ49_18390, partial [Elusimicrobiota bacterium]
KIEVSADADMKAIKAALQPYEYDGIQIGVTSGRWQPYAMSGYGSNNSGTLDPRMARTEEPRDRVDGFKGGPTQRFFSKYGQSLRDIPGVKDVQVGRFNMYYQDSGFPGLKPWGVKIEVSADADMKAIKAALQPYEYDGIQIGVTSGRWQPYAMNGFGSDSSGAFGLDSRMAMTDTH